MKSYTAQKGSVLLIPLLVMGIVLSFSIFFTASYYELSKFKEKNEQTKVLSDEATGIVVDHNSIDLFDTIPDEYLTAAKNTRMIFIDRSVGGNINEGLNCMSYSSTSLAPNFCKRPTLTTSELISNSKYDRSKWTYRYWEGDCGMWFDKIKCFQDMITPVINDYDVLSYQNSYLEVADGTGISDPSTGFFGDNRYDISNLEAIESMYPTKKFIYWTSSLSRSIGSRVSEDFNNQMRNYAIQNNKVLFDVADILSHNPQGAPCYDNRDGIYYTNGNASENYPDDGLNTPAICKEYTSEVDGGHLGSHSTGMNRVSQGFWVLMAQIAGWNPEGGSSGGGSTPPPPTNLAPVVSAGADFSILTGTSYLLNGTATDDGLPAGSTLSITWVKSSGPGNVVFNNSRIIQPTVSFDTAGTYVLRVTVSDSDKSSSDDIQVIVTAPLPDPGDDPGDGTPPDINPTLYLNFDDANTHTGCSTCTNHNTSASTDGIKGSSYSFNGTDSYIDLGSNNFVRGYNNYTISVWLKPSFDETSTTNKYIYSDSTILGIFYLGPLNDFRSLIRTSSGNFRVDTTNLNWDSNTWHNLTYVFNGTSYKVYWDGQLAKTITLTGTLSNNSGLSFIGTSIVKSDYYSGLLDELKVYSSALTDSEVLGLFNDR